MKKFISTIVLAIALSVSASAAGIEFFHGTWAEAVAKAKSENKLIFVDFFTDWCGPCYNMAHTVFILPEVGHYYNNTFINMKIDAEKGEGAELAKKYGVRSYPTYAFIDPATEEMIHRSGSRQEPERFIQTGKDAGTPEKRSFYLNDQYASGNRDRKFLTDYIAYNNSVYARDKVNKAFAELLDNGAKLTDPDVWNIYVSSIGGINSYLKQVSDNYTLFCEKFGKEAVDEKLAKETTYGDPAEIKALCNFDGKEYNLKMIGINSMLRAENYDGVAKAIDAMIADPETDQQKLIGNLKFIARVSPKRNDIPEAWLNKCVEYLRYIAYNNSERDNANIHQEYAAALEKLLQRAAESKNIPASIINAPAHGKKVYDMRPNDLKQKPRYKK